MDVAVPLESSYIYKYIYLIYRCKEFMKGRDSFFKV